VWQGNQDHPLTAGRDIPLRELLAAIPADFEIVSLQKQLNAADAAVLAADPRVRRVDSHLTDMAETAAAMSHLDLTISADTSVVHVAGATGRPVWVFVSVSPDFRWLLARSDSPWYPTLRLIRQTMPGNWDGAFEELRRLLAENPDDRTI
jgi:ADP-heptose:LPS heptosyltransferase